MLTGPQQIDRLTRPGSTYFNLNPYEVRKTVKSVFLRRDKNSLIYFHVPTDKSGRVEGLEVELLLENLIGDM